MLLGWLEPFLQDVLVQVLQYQTVRCCLDSLLQLVDEYVLLLNISCSHPVQTVHTYSTQQPQSVQTGKSLTGNAAGMLLLILVFDGCHRVFLSFSGHCSDGASARRCSWTYNMSSLSSERRHYSQLQNWPPDLAHLWNLGSLLVSVHKLHLYWDKIRFK